MTSSPCTRSPSAPSVVLVAAVVLGAGSHLAAAFGASGAMSWAMVAMGVACLSCLLHLRGSFGFHAVHRAAGHLMTMTVAMIAIHGLLLASMGVGATGHAHGPASHSFAAAEHTAHTTSMLALIGVELVCLAVGAAVMRRARHPQPSNPPRTGESS